MSFISDLLINVSAFRITVGNKINALGNRIGTLTALTTSNKSSLVEAVNELNGKSFSISVGNQMGEINQTNGNTIYPNSIAIYNKQDANTHPKNSGGLEAFSYNAPSAINYPVVTGAGGGGGISFYRNNSAGGLLSSFDIVKAEHSEEKLRFRVGISTTAKGGWKTFASEEYVNDVIAGLGVGEHKSKKFNLIEAYRRTVIPLCPLHNAVNISANYYFFGEVFAKRSNILNSAQAKMTIEVGKYYNSEIPIVNISQTNQVANLFFRPVTFLYNGLRYFGVEIGSNSANYSQAHVDGFASDWNIIEAIDIYNTQNQTILNAEIYNSLQEYTYQNDSYNLRKKHLYKLEAEAFIKRGGTGTNILLDDGNVKPVSDFQNNYVDTIVTTNGTTAGTVYTFKRVGLSDLTLTLTAASASFSGVVTTGAQQFEGVKTFLKSPLVPQAVNPNEAVNKAQLDNIAKGNYHALTVGNSGYETNTTALDLNTIKTNVSLYVSSGINTPTGENGFLNSYGVNTQYSYQIFTLVISGRIFTRRNYNGVWGSWVEIFTTYVFNPAQYVLQSALNTQLANYATLAGTQTFTGQNTFSQPPIVPNGTLNGHTINLGQLNTILNAYALTSAIPTNNNQLTNGAGYITSGALGGYVLQTSLNTQLGNYVTLGSVQTITATKTFNVSPVVPNGTLAGHTVNLGQMQSYVTGLGYTTLAAVQTWVNSQGYLTSSALNGYVLQSSLNTQLANYATLAGTQTFTGQITFAVPPIVPNGSLAGHTVNLGQMQSYVSNAIANIPAQTPNRIYDPTQPINNDYWDKIPIKSVRHDFGFDVCNYEPQTQEYVSIFSNYGAPYLNEGILGSIALMCPHTGVPVIKGTVECQQNLNPYIDNNQIYFCLVYERDTTSPTYLTGSLQMLSIQDIVSHTGSGSVEMFNSIIVLGVATRDNTLMVQHREF